jgi:hypothetical protein
VLALGRRKARRYGNGREAPRGHQSGRDDEQSSPHAAYT